MGMARAIGPVSLSIWEEPGLLIEGYDHPPTVMMGHAKREYREWIEGAGYQPAKQMMTYDLDITQDFPPIVQRIIKSGEKNARIHPFRELGLKVPSAAIAQALLELRSNYCDHKKCLHCTVGNQLLKRVS